MMVTLDTTEDISHDSSLSSLSNLNLNSSDSSHTSNNKSSQILTSRSSTARNKSKPLTEAQRISQRANPPTTATPSSPSTSTSNTPNLNRRSPFQFGSRYLSDANDVFAWNAWDHVDPSSDPVFVEYAEKQFAFQREHRASEVHRKDVNSQPEKWWDRFYGVNGENFFKDRKWLRLEFPVLGVCCGNLDREVEPGKENVADGGDGESERKLGKEEKKKLRNGDEETGRAEQATTEILLPDINDPANAEVLRAMQSIAKEPGPWNTVLEIGAGAGNTAFPLLRCNRNPNLMVHAVDFSKKAVKVMQESELYDPKHLVASQWDMASETLPSGLTPGSVDVVALIFAFSALSPKQWVQAVRNVYVVLRPGGEVCFRDYGRGDLAQVRFKKGRYLGQNFYVRGDGTRVYFFEEEELRRIWSGGAADAAKEVLDADTDAEAGNEESEYISRASPIFDIVKLGTDRRLLVNRQKQLKMYRCWMQGRLRKPLAN